VAAHLFCKLLDKIAGGFEQIGKKHDSISKQLIDLKQTGIKFDNLKVFVNIRNPFDRVVSMYSYRKQFSQRIRMKNIEFEDFLYNEFLNSGKDEYISQFDHIAVDGRWLSNTVLIPMEVANETWIGILRDVFRKETDSIPHENPSTHDHWYSYYDDRMMNDLRKKESWVCEHYGL